MTIYPRTVSVLNQQTLPNCRLSGWITALLHLDDCILNYSMFSKGLVLFEIMNRLLHCIASALTDIINKDTYLDLFWKT